MSDSSPLPPDTSPEEREFFSLFSQIRGEFQPLVDDFARKVVHHIRHHQDDERADAPHVNDIVTSGLLTAVKSFLSIWMTQEDAREEEDE